MRDPLTGLERPVSNYLKDYGELSLRHDIPDKDLAGLTLRFAVTNLIGARSMWQRYVYVDRRDGPLAWYEDRDRRIGPIFQFSVSGKF